MIRETYTALPWKVFELFRREISKNGLRNMNTTSCDTDILSELLSFL